MTQNPEPHDGLDTPALVTSGIVAAIATFAVIVGLQVLYLRFAAAQAAKNQGASTARSSASSIAEQKSKLNRYGWIDRSKNVVAIPIDRAIEISAKELNSSDAASLNDSVDVSKPPESS